MICRRETRRSGRSKDPPPTELPNRSLEPLLPICGLGCAAADSAANKSNICSL